MEQNPQKPQEKSAIDGCLRGITNQSAVCGWAVVQMDLDGGMTPRCGVGGILPISLEVQRTIKRAENWALYMALRKLCGPFGDFL